MLPLVQHFIGRFNEENGRQYPSNWRPACWPPLKLTTGPACARIENVVERAVIIAPGDEISLECLRPEIINQQVYSPPAREGSGGFGMPDFDRGVNFYDEVRRFEIDLIRRALEQTSGHQSRAARLLGMNATTLNSKIKTYNIQLRP
ncbi:MAG: helix-turn-helix domain-containing protein [Pyrinomonadaceae bacterium]